MTTPNDDLPGPYAESNVIIKPKLVVNIVFPRINERLVLLDNLKQKKAVLAERYEEINNQLMNTAKQLADVESIITCLEDENEKENRLAEGIKAFAELQDEMGASTADNVFDRVRDLWQTLHCVGKDVDKKGFANDVIEAMGWPPREISESDNNTEQGPPHDSLMPSSSSSCSSSGSEGVVVGCPLVALSDSDDEDNGAIITTTSSIPDLHQRQRQSGLLQLSSQVLLDEETEQVVEVDGDGGEVVVA